MKTTKYILTLLLTVWCVVGNLYAVEKSYYTSVDGKSGTALREALTTLTYTKHTTDLGYNWTFDGIDIVNGEILDIYSTCSWTTSQQGKSYSNICDGYNREHVVPQSVFNEAAPQKGDRHHLFLADGQVNNLRSSYPFGETNVTTAFSGYSNGNKALGKLGAASSGYSGTVYEPDDEYKGDIARAVLYMAIRYATSDVCRKYGGTANSYPVTAWNNAMFSGSLSTNYGLSNNAVTTFLKWHRADPPSAKEIARNNGVEKKQGNRNPFIDLPDLVEYLWGNQAGQTVDLNSLTIATGGGSVPTTYEISLNRNGATETVTCSGTYTLPTASTEADACDGWAFAGWSSSSSINTTTAPTFTTSVSSATTLYAVYSNTTSSAPHRAKMAESSATYTFTSKSWAASPKDWTSNKDGNGYGNSGVQVTTGSSGANATCPDSYSNITSIVVSYCTNASKGAGTIIMTVDGNDVSQSVSTSGGTTARNLTFDFSSIKPSGNPKITVTCTTNSIYVCGVTITYGDSGSGGGGGGTTTYKTTPDCGSAHSITLSSGGSVSGGTFEASATSAYQGATITLYADPSDGYAFGSWSVTKQGGGSVTVTDNQFTMPDVDVTVSATFNALPTYNIRFYNNGTQIGSTQSVYKGGKPNVPSNPESCEGYTFVGWWTSALAANNTTAQTWITDFTVTQEQNYYAIFSHTETSGSGGNASSASYTFTSKSWAATEGNWTSGTDGAGYNNSGVQVTTGASGANATCPSSYSNITSIVVSYCTNTSSGVGSIKMSVGSTELTQSVTKTGGTTARDLTFDFSSTKPSGEPKITVNCTTNSIYVCGVTINYGGGGSTTTHYTSSPDCSTPQNVTVSFNANGGTGTMANQTITYNTATALTANTFTRTGYTFQGWATSANGNKVYDNSASVTLTENTTLYALWTVNSYTITTNAGTGGSLSTSPSGNANFGATVTITVTPDDTHTVGSVSVKDASNNDVSVSGTGNERTFTMPASNVTVSATFNQKQQYSINFIVDGETISTQNLYEGATAQKPTDPTACEGYTFVGWWTSTLAADNTTAQTWITDFTVSGAQDYYAVFSHTETSGSGGGSTSITLNAQTDKEFPQNGITLSVTDGALNNGTDYRVYKSQKLTITSTVGDITSIALTYSGANYDGGGWSDSYTPNAATWTSPVANGEQARITKIVITIDGGSSSSTTYYTSSPDCVTPCSTLATPVVTATPSNGQITLTWADVEGADHYSVTISKGAGYTTECGNAANIGTITGTTTKTCVITGLTNGLTYTTSVIAHASSENCNSEADEDTAIPTECEDWTDPTLTWSAYNLNTTGTNTATCSISGTTHGTRSFESSNTEVLTVASDGTVTAVGAGTATVTVSWTAADGYCEKSIISDAFEVAGPLTISFDANGGEGTMSDQTVTYKVSTAIKENAFTRTGYTFQGWALTAAGSKEYNDKQSVAFTNSLTLYAVWQLNSHEVTFTSSVTGATVTVNGQSSSPQTAEYGSTVTLLITPTEHYIVSALTVSGTSGSVDISGTGNTRTFTMPDEAVTVTLTMVAESQYTATFYNGAETFATVSGYADDDIAAPTGTPTSCDDETFTFVGWVATAQTTEVTTSPQILTFPQVMTSGGVSYYALFRRSEGGSGGEASVTFKTASQDGSTEYSTDSDIKTNIVDTYTGIASFEGSKAYPGKSGVKLGSSKNAGSITLNLSSPITTDKITVEAVKYGTDAGDLKIEVNGSTAFGSAMSPAGGTLEFTDDEMEISSLTVLTTSARAYVASISLGGGGTSYYTTAPECAACENQVTITKGTEEHGTFTLSKASGSYDNCKSNVSVTVSGITPDEGYYCTGVTATGSHMHVAVSGPDGSGNYTVAYAKGYSVTSTITANFAVIPSHTVTWSANGSTTTATYSEGAAITFPTTATGCDGMEFMGWSAVEVEEQDEAPTYTTSATMGTEDITYYAVFAVATLGSGSGALETLFSEDFSSITSGNNTSTSGSSNSWSGNDNIEYVSAAYQAGGAVKIGGGNSAGSIQTKELSVTAGKEITVSFDVKGWTTVEGNITVTVTGCDAQTITYTQTMSGSFETKTATFTLTSDSPTVTIATTAKRAFIDNVIVTTAGGSGTTYTGYTTSCVACENTVTINKGTPSNGSFSIDKTGAQNNCSSGGLVVTVSDITPASGYEFGVITQTGINSGVTIDQSAKTVTYAQNVTGTSTINVVFVALPTYTIRFIDNGAVISTQEVAADQSAVKPSPDPTPCDEKYTFEGWANATLAEDSETKPTLISDFTASQDQDYYAVYSYSEENSSAPVRRALSKATSISTGDKVVFVCENVVKEMTSISSTSTPYGIGSDYTGTPAGTFEFDVVTGNSTGTLAFKNGDNYLNWSSGNSLNVNGTLSDNTSWKVEIDGSGNATIKNANDENRVIWWNVSSPRFACYTGKTAGTSYYNIQLYKNSSGGGGGTTTTTYYTTAPDCEAPIVTSAKMLVAEYGGARVALMHDNTNTVAALPLMYFGGNYFIPNIDKNGNTASAPEKETLTWQVAERTDGYYIKSDDNKFLAQTEGEFELDNESFLWPKQGALRLAYDADIESFVVAAGEQGDLLPGITPVDVPGSISLTELNSPRDLTIGRFGTICLPHAVALPFTWGVKVYSIEGAKMTDDKLVGIYMVEETEMLTAGKPYLIEALTEKMNMWYATGAPTADKAVEAKGLVGNLGAEFYIDPTQSDYYYVLSNNQLRRVGENAKVKVGQYKAYFDLEGLSEPATMPQAYAFKVMYVENNEQVETDLNEVPATINWDEPVYNILGMRVDRNATGVLIQGGTKFIIRVP